MLFSEYQEFASKGIHGATLEREPVVGFALGLVGETGEVVDDIKKRIYHGRDIPLQHTAEELGDVLWYVANIATQYGFNLDDIVAQNMKKLKNRYPGKYSEDVGAHPTVSIADEPIILQLKNEGLYFTRKGPHIAMYDSKHKFIKFINKEEKKKYGFEEGAPWD